MARRLVLATGGAALSATLLALTGLGGTGSACAQSVDPVAPRPDCPSAPAATPLGSASSQAPGSGTAPQRLAATCSTPTLLRGVSVGPAGRGVEVRFRRVGAARVSTAIFQSATRRMVIGERLVFRSKVAGPTVRWSGRRQRGRPAPRDGVYFVRVTARRGGALDVRRLTLRRVSGRFRVERSFARRDGCGPVRAFKLERPAFGGRNNRAVSISFRLARESQAVVELRRGGARVRRLTSATRTGGVLHRVRLDAEGLRRGRYEVRLRVGATTVTLFLRRI